MTPNVAIHTDVGHDYRLQRAILLYGSGRTDASYASIHDVSTEFVIEAGRPLDHADIAEFIAALYAKNRVSGYLPGHILYSEAGFLAWWVPPATRRVWFQCGKEAAGDQTVDTKGAALLGSRSGPAPHPGLVFAVNPRGWYVRALLDDQRPAPHTQLHVAPYFNVWAGGQICTGNVRLPDNVTAAVTKAYEDAFFRSRFTHPNVPRLTAAKGGSYRLWSDLLDRNPAHFPVKHLLPARQSLEQWIKSIQKGKP